MFTKVVGVTFDNEDGSSRRMIIESMSLNDKIVLERDPYNEYDSNAVKVCVVKGGRKMQIGFLARNVAAEVSPKLRRGAQITATIMNCGVYMDSPFCDLDISGI